MMANLVQYVVVRPIRKKATEQSGAIDENELNDLRDKKNIAEKLHVQVEEKWNFYHLQYEQVIEEVRSEAINRKNWLKHIVRLFKRENN